jgi:pimeloyl-ACP methyl ester carboxylesterase
VSHYPADKYLQFIVHELKPYLDRHYRTLPDKNNTLVAGSSIGALISFYALTEYPNVFGRAACLATHWQLLLNSENPSSAQNALRYIEHKLPMAGSHRFYFDFSAETLEQYGNPYQGQVDNVLQAKGYVQGQDLITKKIPGAGRDENSWQVKADKMLEFLLGENTNQ